MSQIDIIARFTVHEGQTERFKELAANCVRIVREQDSGTLKYDWFFADDDTECVVVETYRDSEAVLEHIEHVGEQLNALLEVSDIGLEFFGAPSDELLAASEALAPKTYGKFQGS